MEKIGTLIFLILMHRKQITQRIRVSSENDLKALQEKLAE